MAQRCARWRRLSVRSMHLMRLPQRLKPERNCSQKSRDGLRAATVFCCRWGGSEGPLRVVFHAGLGTMDCFRPMLAELEKDPRGPVIGIVIADTAQYCALSPQQAVERMADDYAQRLLATGHSRFQLIGYCLGGLFAVEVARRLSEQGAESLTWCLSAAIRCCSRCRMI
ncbi:enterobactin synthase subunit F [Klebsiella pneumoniae subsp. ozaenae]|uniref:Enterobactin synthase subunit F n=1 Tax=Klebsiella pneumoniae subsp. ozaenae TaxID=574 RepID=A0A377YUB8_KLEPO|nr:enterobactin synthase subunit F [Klebsiella pneumoniae subsp. ozaenae]